MIEYFKQTGALESDWRWTSKDDNTYLGVYDANVTNELEDEVSSKISSGTEIVKMSEFRREMVSESIAPIFVWELDFDKVADYLSSALFENDKSKLNLFLLKHGEILCMIRSLFNRWQSNESTLDEVLHIHPVFMNFGQLMLNDIASTNFECISVGDEHLRINLQVNVTNLNVRVKSKTIAGCSDLAIISKGLPCTPLSATDVGEGFSQLTIQPKKSSKPSSQKAFPKKKKVQVAKVASSVSLQELKVPFGVFCKNHTCCVDQAYIQAWALQDLRMAGNDGLLDPCCVKVLLSDLFAISLLVRLKCKNSAPDSALPSLSPLTSKPSPRSYSASSSSFQTTVSSKGTSSSISRVRAKSDPNLSSKSPDVKKYTKEEARKSTAWVGGSECAGAGASFGTKAAASACAGAGAVDSGAEYVSQYKVFVTHRVVCARNFILTYLLQLVSIDENVLKRLGNVKEEIKVEADNRLTAPTQATKSGHTSAMSSTVRQPLKTRSSNISSTQTGASKTTKLRIHPEMSWTLAWETPGKRIAVK